MTENKQTVVSKSDLVVNIANELELTQTQVRLVVDTFLTSIENALTSRQKVQLVGFGTFNVSHRAERKGVNPQTKEALVIPERNAPVFKAGKQLKNAVQ